MVKRLLPLVVLALIPVMVHADASVVQDSCVVVGTPPNASVWTYFTVVNFSLPTSVCDVHFIPEPQPPNPGCEMIGCVAPAGWSCFLNPLGGGDWFANTPTDCIAPGTHKGGFAFLLDPAYCCYIVQFTDATGAVILEQEECFTCQKVPVDEKSWGAIKEMYQ
ncbi:MAG: hypothetical protein P8181_09270 [bacterium]